MNKTLTAVLFGGGLSRRMGVDKATLPFAGEPLWARQVRLLCELSRMGFGLPPARGQPDARRKSKSSPTKRPRACR